MLARAKAAGLTTKSGLIVGMGETDDEVAQTLADLRAVGVDIVTIGQYLRPTVRHLPIVRFWEPADFDRIAEFIASGKVVDSLVDRCRKSIPRLDMLIHCAAHFLQARITVEIGSTHRGRSLLTCAWAYHGVKE